MAKLTHDYLPMYLSWWGVQGLMPDLRAQNLACLQSQQKSQGGIWRG